MEIPPAKEQFGGSNVNPNGEKYYVTTAINYTNGVPHIGHMYEALLADVVARYNRVYGRKVFFLTGTDEHGQKIAKSAEAAGKTPKEQCDMYVAAFQALNKRLHISNDEYIRTTDPYHEESCRALWKRCCDNGDIYLGSYNGWYDEGEENFVTPANAEKQGFKDAFGRDLKQIKESCYFFRLSKYGDRLKEYHSSRPDSIIPENRRQEVLSMLEDGLQDLCISRTTFDWGISLPEGFEEKHVMYVWFDALTNYVSATHLLLPEDRRDPERVQNWPADAHIIGKDITRFHCIYWPAMLWSAGLELPKSVVGHGFVQDENGQKMSKSLGNVIDPNDLLDKYPSDSVRFFMCNEAAFGSDLKASEMSLVQTHNTNLANTVGNLVMRAIRLTRLYTDGEVPAKPEGVTLELPFDLDELRTNVETWMKAYQTNKVVSEVVKACSEVNNLITVKEPFKMKEESQRPLRTLCVRIILESVYILAHFLAPFLPLTATAILEKIQPGTTIAALKADFTNLEAGRKLSDSKYAETGEGSVVPFEKILTDEERAKAEQKQKLAEEAKKKAAEKAAKGGAGKHADPKKPAPKAAAEEKPEFDASGWRLGVKSDLAQRWYLQEQGDKQYPDVSGVLTLSDGLFDMAVYAKDESASGNVLHTENGPLKQLLARTGGTKFDAKTSTVTLKPHHSTDASEVAKDATPKKYVVKVSKKGALKFEADGDSTVWCKRRQL